MRATPLPKCRRAAHDAGWSGPSGRVAAQGGRQMLFVILTIALHSAALDSAPLHTDGLHAGAQPVTASPKGVMAPMTSLPGEPPYGLSQGRHVVRGKQVCFRDPVSGSKIPTKRCMSREAFEQRQQDSKDHLDTIQRDSRIQAGT
jgi:hypothetical protein